MKRGILFVGLGMLIAYPTYRYADTLFMQRAQAAQEQAQKGPVVGGVQLDRMLWPPEIPPVPNPPLYPDPPNKPMHIKWADIVPIHDDKRAVARGELATPKVPVPHGDSFRSHRFDPGSFRTKSPHAVRSPQTGLISHYGDADQHDAVTDFFILTGGKGKYVAGGEILNREYSRQLGPYACPGWDGPCPRNEGTHALIMPGEHHGQPVRGGQEFPSKLGSWLNIPPGVVHWWIPDAGEGLSYMLMKVIVPEYPTSLTPPEHSMQPVASPFLTKPVSRAASRTDEKLKDCPDAPPGPCPDQSQNPNFVNGAIKGAVWESPSPSPLIPNGLRTLFPNMPRQPTFWDIDDIRKSHQILADAELAGKKVEPNTTLHDFPFWTRTHSMFLHHVPVKPAGDMAQQHVGYTQFVVITGGTGSVVTGGRLQGGHVLTEGSTQIWGEMRGRSIAGGETFQLTEGDWVSIPANTPAHFIAKSPGGLTYMVMKVNAMLYPWELTR